MLELIVLVVLVAWFFGITYGAALHGVLGVLFALVILGFIIMIIDSIHESYVNRPAKIPAPKQIQKQAPKRTIKKRQPTIVGTIIEWIIIFIVSYIITLLLMVCLSRFVRLPELGWFESIMPTIPFVIFAASRIIRAIMRNKKAH